MKETLKETFTRKRSESKRIEHLDHVRSGKSNTTNKPTSNNTSITYQIPSQKYFLSQIDGKTYAQSNLNMNEIGLVYHIVKYGAATPTVKQVSNGQSIEYNYTQLTNAEFQAILSGKPKWNELKAAYSFMLLNSTERMKLNLNTDNSKVVW